MKGKGNRRITNTFWKETRVMKKLIYLAPLVLAILGFCAGENRDDCSEDIQDSRGIMKPWEKGARESGKYRNVFLEAGFSQSAIDT